MRSVEEELGRAQSKPTPAKQGPDGQSLYRHCSKLDRVTHTALVAELWRLECYCRSFLRPTRLPLQQRFGEQFRHMLWARVCEIDNLMTAACAGSDDLCSGRLIV